MFKKIQNYLLLRYPLIWNTRIVFVLLFAVVLHLANFIIGYINGALNFKYDYRSDDIDLIILIIESFSVLIAIIIWLIYYFKNNAFKATYPKSNNALFQEWILIVLGFVVLISFSMTYYFAKEVRVRSYYSKDEVKKRCQTIQKASVFFEGIFHSSKLIDETGTIKFNGRTYSSKSLMNKEVLTFSDLFNKLEDSIVERKVKMFMFNNQKDSIRKILNDYLKIVEEHRLKTNVTTDKWMDLIYEYPEFVIPNIVETRNSEYNNDYVLEKIDGYDIERYFVPNYLIYYNYNLITESYGKPYVDFKFLTIIFCIAFGISGLVFCYRITSGKHLIFSIVAYGVLHFSLSIIMVLNTIINNNYENYLFHFLEISLYLFIYGYFISIFKKNKSKKWTAIALNIIIYTFPMITVVIYYLILEIIKEKTGFDVNYIYEDNKFPIITFLQSNGILLVNINLMLTIIFMFIMSRVIKKWRAIAED